MPILKPLVENCAKNISNPEARSIAEKSLNTLNKACGEDFKPNKYNLDDIQVVLNSQINKLDCNNLDINSSQLSNLSEIILELSNIQYFEYNIWSELFSKYLNISESSDICKIVYDNFKVINETKDERFVDNEEGADLYKGEFSLAYGALTLLNNTYIHLKKK